MRTVIQAYGPSNSAKALAEYTGFKRLLTRGSRFKARPSDVIINWGLPTEIHRCGYLNPIHSVRLATNKAKTFEVLSTNGISVPKVIAKANLEEGKTYLARTILNGHSGEGIIPFTFDGSNAPTAPLYVEFIEKTAEYRVIAVGDNAVDVKQKLRKRDFEGERSHYVWNLDNGYIMARNDISFPDTLPPLGVAAIKALGLTYGAVDIIMDARGNLYVLEINTAFGLEGATIALVGDAIKQLIGEQICAG